MPAHLIRGDARRLPLADKSVQMICTSPPYFGLRQYSTNPVIWGGDPECPHALEDGPAVKPMTGGTGAASKKQVTNAGSQFGNAWAEERGPRGGRHASAVAEGIEGGRAFDKHAIPANRYTTSATCARCGAWRGELGSEPTPALFVAHIVEVMRECWRVLRDDGVAFVNMGDSMAGSGKGPTGHNGIGDQGQRQGFVNSRSTRKRGGLQGGTMTVDQSLGAGRPAGTRPKSLLLVPERLAIALSDDGWIVRQVLIWAKNNPMPESVRDRWTTAHEYVLMLVKQPRYFFDQAGIQEPSESSEESQKRAAYGAYDAGTQKLSSGEGTNDFISSSNGRYFPATRNGRSVWNLNGESYAGAHFATFPREIPRRCILAGTSDYGACKRCGAPYRRTTEHTTLRDLKVRHAAGEPPKHAARVEMGLRSNRSGLAGSNSHNGSTPGSPITTTTGWTPSCKCGPAAGVRPCVVLDPFSGSGTSCFVAASMGRIGVGVELSSEYTEQARYGRLAQEFLPI